MTAAKAIKSEGQAVVVDTSEQGQLPDIVRKALRSKGGPMPHVVFADPGMKHVYGTFSHTELKRQDYRDIFRDTKRKIRDAQKEGEFSVDLSGGGAAVADNEDGEEAGMAEEPSAPGRVAIENAEFATWISNSGTRLNAKLLAVEGDDVFIFETTAGKEIRATAAQLSEQSVQRARELAGL